MSWRIADNRALLVRWIVCFLLVSSGATLGCKKASLAKGSGSGMESQEHALQSEFLAAVIRVLEENRRSGSVIYRGSCTKFGGVTDSLKVARPPLSTSLIGNLRQSFAANPSVSVKVGSSGMVRVVGGDVEPGLLEVRIHEVRIQAENDPREVTAELLASSEVKAYVQAHRTEFVMSSGGIFPLPSGRRLSVTLRDVTLSKALDRILETFPGVWTYRECITAEGNYRVEVFVHEFSSPPISP